jgi:threonine aldolase
MLGKEAGLFVSSGTQGNLVSVLSHCQRGDEFIAGQQAHTYRFEAGGAAVLGGIQPQPLDFEADGTLNLEQVKNAIKPDNVHFAKTRLLCLENTQGGKVLPLAYLAEARALADAHGLSTHLDGARIFNAAVKLDVDVQDIAKHFESVTFCLSKGLAAPAGSLVCGSKEFIRRAHRWRKMLGGAMRQSGVLAAAGLVSLTQMVERMADDHANAYKLAEGLANIPGIDVNLDTVQTNMVFFTLAQPLVGNFTPFMAEQGIVIGDGPYPIRAVAHYGIERDDIDKVIEAAAACSKQFLN